MRAATGTRPGRRRAGRSSSRFAWRSASAYDPDGRVSPCATSADDRRGEALPFRRGADRAMPPEGQRRLGADRRPLQAQGVPHRLQVHGPARRRRGPDPGDLPQGLQEPREVQPRRRLLDLALQRGPELLHRPLPGQQAREGGAGRGPGGLRPRARLRRRNPHRALEDRDRRTLPAPRAGARCPTSCGRRWCCATCRG